mgnify:CR=1 FL=1
MNRSALLRYGLLLAALSWTPFACADLVKLKNGSELVGKITYEDEQGITLELAIGGVMQLKREEIEAIEKREESTDDPEIADGKKKDPKKPPAKPPAKKPPPKKPPPKKYPLLDRPAGPGRPAGLATERHPDRFKDRRVRQGRVDARTVEADAVSEGADGIQTLQ